MNALVATQVAGLGESPAAIGKRAREGLLTSVRADVCDEVGSLVEFLGTFGALISLGCVALALTTNSFLDRWNHGCGSGTRVCVRLWVGHSGCHVES